MQFYISNTAMFFAWKILQLICWDAWRSSQVKTARNQIKKKKKRELKKELKDLLPTKKKTLLMKWKNFSLNNCLEMTIHYEKRWWKNEKPKVNKVNVLSFVS